AAEGNRNRFLRSGCGRGLFRRTAWQVSSLSELFSEPGKIDLVRASPIQGTVSADLGADVLQEVPSVGRQPERSRRRRGLDEAGFFELLHCSRSLDILRSLARERAPASPALLDLQQHFEPVELLTKAPRVTEKITHGALSTRGAARRPLRRSPCSCR